MVIKEQPMLPKPRWYRPATDKAVWDILNKIGINHLYYYWGEHMPQFWPYDDTKPTHTHGAVEAVMILHELEKRGVIKKLEFNDFLGGYTFYFVKWKYDAMWEKYRIRTGELKRSYEMAQEQVRHMEPVPVPRAQKLTDLTVRQRPRKPKPKQPNRAQRLKRKRDNEVITAKIEREVSTELKSKITHYYAAVKTGQYATRAHAHFPGSFTGRVEPVRYDHGNDDEPITYFEDGVYEYE